MSELYKYANLIAKNTPYATKMRALANKIFGEVVQPTDHRSMRIVKMYSEEPLYKRDLFVKYYPRHVETGRLMYHLRAYGLFRDEHQDFKDDFLRLKTLRGKGPRPFKYGVKKTRTLIETR